jgi:HEAT repeats
VVACAAMFGSTLLPRTLEAAIRDLGSAKASVRAEAARDLARHAPEARAEVARSLEGALADPAAEVRAAAATALADADAGNAIPALIRAMDDPEPVARQMVTAALGELAEPTDTAAVDRLRRALVDREPQVRFQATIAFPRLAPSRDAAVEALLRASNDDDTFVCHIALRMAEELLVVEGAALDERLFTRARALLTRGTPMVRVASALLLVRARASGGDGDGAASRPVREVLIAVALGELSTTDGQDEAAAIELCGEFGLDEARPGLERRAFGRALFLRDRFGWHACVALARMGHARAREQIVRDLGARDRDLRTLAVAAAGRARIDAARGLIASMRGDERCADPHAVDEALAALAAAEGVGT